MPTTKDDVLKAYEELDTCVKKFNKTLREYEFSMPALSMLARDMHFVRSLIVSILGSETMVSNDAPPFQTGLVEAKKKTLKREKL